MDPVKKYGLNRNLSDLPTEKHHSNDDKARGDFPFAFKFKRPNNSEFSVHALPLTPRLTLKELMEQVADFKRAYFGGRFHKNAYEYEFSFNGKTYPADTTLETIHADIDLSKITCIEAKETHLKVAKDKLKQQTGIKWKVNFEGALEFVSENYRSRDEFDAFIKKSFAKAPHLEKFFKIGFEKRSGYGGSQGSNSFDYYHASISISDSHLIKMIALEDILEINRAVPLIAQAMRNPAGFSLGALPLEVILTLGPLLAPKLSPTDAYEMMKEKIQQANKEFSEKPIFRKMKPVVAAGVRQSVGATACLLLGSGKVTAEQARNLGNIAYVEFSNGGMTLKFPDKKYAERFLYGLKNSGYSAVSFEEKVTKNNFGHYQADVTISDLHEVKRFIEVTCGYPKAYTRDLFKACSEKITLPHEFFINQLKLISASTTLATSDQKKEAAKVLMADYLPYLDPVRAKQFRQTLVVMANTNENGEPGPFQFLREKTGVGRFLSGNLYSDSVGTFKEILAAIDDLVLKNN